MQVKFTLLGTGTSHGVPVIGCDCAVCTSPDPRNRRFRCSALLEYGGRAVLIDTSMDLRMQAIRAGMTSLDAVLFTHSHNDHIGGLDDLRVFSERQHMSIPCYGSDGCLEDIRRRFDYIFEDVAYGGARPRLDLIPMDGQVSLFGLDFLPVLVFHGPMPVYGFRFGNVAYVTDLNMLPDSSAEMLSGLDILVLDALRWKPHSTHFSVEQSLAVVDRLKPARTFFTHMTHDLDHVQTNEKLPPGVELAYDGLSFCLEI